MKKFLAMLLILLVAIPTGLILAQETPDTRPVELPNGHTLDLPMGWALEQQNDGEPDIYRFKHGESAYLLVMLPAATEPYYAGLDTMPTPAELLVLLADEGVITLEIIASEIEEVSADTESMEPENSAQVAFDDEEGQGIARASAWGDGLAYIEYYAPAETFEVTENAVNVIVNQFEAMVTADCMVSTDNRDGIPMRLGPGFNRGEYTSLRPEDGDVPVLAGFTAADGSLWWRVEESYEAVNQLWVLDSDVITSGNCDAIAGTGMPGPTVSGENAAGGEGVTVSPAGGGEAGGEVFPEGPPIDVIVVTVVPPGGN